MRPSDWLFSRARALTDLGGALLVVDLFLVALLAATLPRDKRRMLRSSLALLALFALATYAAPQLPARRGETDWVATVAQASLLLVTARTALLVVTDSLIGRAVLPPVPKIIADILQGLLYGVVALISLHGAGFEPGELLTTSALLTAVIGLALQDTLGNLFSGLAMQAAKPFEVDDWVQVDGNTAYTGKILEIGWRATRMLTIDESEIVIPNGVLAKAVLRNFTKPTPVERRQVLFGVDYRHPPGRVRTAALDALRGLPGILAQPEPSVVTLDLADSGIQYALRYYIDQHAEGTPIDATVRERLWYALQRRGLSFPFPQRDVHLYTHGPAERAADHAADVEARSIFLRFVPLFQGLPEPVVRELAERARTQHFGAHEAIVRQGEPGDDMYVLVRGTVSVRVGDAEVATLGREGYFGEASLLTGEPRGATVVALTEVELCEVGHEALQTVLRCHPELYDTLTAAMVERQLVRDAQLANASRPPAAQLEAHRRDLLKRIRSFFA